MAEMRKKVLVPGQTGKKPYESSECRIKVVEGPELLESFDNKVVTIGDNDGDIGRMLDTCLISMNLGERAKFEVTLNDAFSFILELVELNFKGFVFEWDANRFHSLAKHHKDKGVELFKQNNFYDASFRFTKALKLISLIPIDVQTPPDTIDGIKVKDIQTHKANLYHNLSSCYFKKERYGMVIELCKKVFLYDENHVKALYKIGVAYENDKDFENAKKALSRVLKMEPNNKACAEHLVSVKEQLKKAEVRTNVMMKKMFEAI